MNLKWVEPDIRDNVVEFINMTIQKTDIVMLQGKRYWCKKNKQIKRIKIKLHSSYPSNTDHVIARHFEVYPPLV